MDIDKRMDLILSVGEETLTRDELYELLKEKPHPVAYNGFEPSGRLHLAQSIMAAINVNKLIDAGCRVKMLVADWHAQANNKLGGDLTKIQTTGQYFIEVWKASGMKLESVEFVWASDLVKDPDYWQLVVRIAMMNSVERITRCSQIMGRSDKESLSAAQILYPCMQAADIFYMGIDICQLGMDQRKVNVLAREMAHKLSKKKPIIVSHHMLMGLSEPPKDVADPFARAAAMKMSKSVPDSAIFSTDTKEDVERKIKKAFCPEKQVEENPVVEYCKYLIFPRDGKLRIDRPVKFGGPLEFTDFEDFATQYGSGAIHPMDLKNAVAAAINAMLEPIREHFARDEAARRLKETVESYEVTR
jgi:tyrosyl-tRNA synthetase